MSEVIWTGDNLAEIVSCLGSVLMCTELQPNRFYLVITTKFNKAKVAIGQTLQYTSFGYVRVK